MDSEVPLPPQPRIRHRSPARSSSARPGSRSSFQKPYRLSSRFDDCSSLPSSDPAFFSSDDIPASGLENYNAPVSAGASTRKRRYRGTWWGETVIDPKRKRADFKEKRHVDSGVWMGSDESGAESLLPSEDASVWGEDLLNNMPDSQAVSGNANQLPNSAAIQPRAVFRGAEESKEHQFARAIVNECLEKGQDSIDLSNGFLRTIPSGLLQPLQHLTKLPAIKEPPITEDVYSSLEPFLRLFLAGNALTTLPGELFELGSLKVLSLRNNKLTDLPPAVRKLTMLQELNLSVNRLQCLPWELLWLIRKSDLKHLVVRPNPLQQIDEADIAEWHYLDETDGASPKEALKLCNYEGSAPEEAWAPIHVATGPVRRFDMEGFVLEDGQTQRTNEDVGSRVPSLREIALLAFSKSPYVHQVLESELDYFPELMQRLLKQASDVRNAGGRCCSVCHRSFVIPRTEWIEWWDCSTYENGLKGPRCPGEKLRPLPFRRFGCSPGCVPGAEKNIVQGEVGGEVGQGTSDPTALME